MKNKYLFIKIFGIAFLIFLIIVYFLVYFIPSIEEINRRKRELKDMNFKIESFLNMEKEFSFADQREQQLLSSVDQGLKDRIPEVKNREDFISLFTRVLDYIKTRAHTDGIDNLVLTSTSSELQLNATTLFTDKKSLEQLLNFATVRLAQLKNQMQVIPGASPPGTPPRRPALLPGLSHQTVFLSFTGQLTSSMNFVNHIPWSDYYLRADKIMLATGESMPYYFVHLKVYYIDQRLEDVKQ
ncbi:MAG: hypothetical protein GY950_09715 [bacterium]|nr:hypothetical protein [bacterium]